MRDAFGQLCNDFIITGDSPETLTEVIKPAVERFLVERGLVLSPEKTKITHIDDGFDFLGFNLRKYNGKLLIKPAKDSVNRHLAQIRSWLKSNPTCTKEHLLRKLNPMISGWANYYRHVVASNTFHYVGHHIYHAILRWCRRRHPKKNNLWIQRRYYYQPKGLTHFRFYTAMYNPKEQYQWRWYLKHASDLPIVRHIKIRAIMHPYLPDAVHYFKQRDKWSKHRKHIALVEKFEK